MRVVHSVLWLGATPDLTATRRQLSIRAAARLTFSRSPSVRELVRQSVVALVPPLPSPTGIRFALACEC
jgi:hypothetical protein